MAKNRKHSRQKMISQMSDEESELQLFSHHLKQFQTDFGKLQSARETDYAKKSKIKEMKAKIVALRHEKFDTLQSAQGKIAKLESDCCAVRAANDRLLREMQSKQQCLAMMSEQNKAVIAENERMKRQRQRFQTNIDQIMSNVAAKDFKINTLTNRLNEQSRCTVQRNQREVEDPRRAVHSAELRLVGEEQTKQDESHALEEWRRNNAERMQTQLGIQRI